MSTAAMTLKQIVLTNPGAAEVLERHGLDYCCRGHRSLATACQQAGLAVLEVEAELARLAPTEPAEADWRRRPLSELIDHILERYHKPLRRDLPALIALARKVERLHADKPTCPLGLAEHLTRIHAAVESHLAKEERGLFPRILAGLADTVQAPIQAMMREHVEHGESLRLTRTLTRNLTPPPEACASWRELYRGLARLETELWKHVFLEDHVLAPRALAGRGVQTPPGHEADTSDGCVGAAGERV